MDGRYKKNREHRHFSFRSNVISLVFLILSSTKQTVT